MSDQTYTFAPTDADLGLPTDVLTVGLILTVVSALFAHGFALPGWWLTAAACSMTSIGFAALATISNAVVYRVTPDAVHYKSFFGRTSIRFDEVTALIATDGAAALKGPRGRVPITTRRYARLLSLVVERVRMAHPNLTFNEVAIGKLFMWATAGDWTAERWAAVNKPGLRVVLFFGAISLAHVYPPMTWTIWTGLFTFAAAQYLLGAENAASRIDDKLSPLARSADVDHRVVMLTAMTVLAFSAVGTVVHFAA